MPYTEEELRDNLHYQSLKERDEIIEKEEEAELETQKEEHHRGHEGPENKDLQASPKN